MNSRIRCTYILSLLILNVFTGYASTDTKDITGTVRDSLDMSPQTGAVIELVDTVSGQSTAYRTSDTEGNFIFEKAVTSGRTIRVSMMGYITKNVRISEDGRLGDILIVPESQFIESALVKGEAIRSTQSGDTLSYNAAAYRTMLGSDSEALISKMPGISVTDEGVDANGRDVRKIMIDGQEFFGDDVLTALKNIPADMIAQIEVINKLSDEAQLTGVDDGNGYTAINIVTKRQTRDGSLVGRLYGGYGIPDKYMAGGNVNYFDEKQSASLVGMGNNISKYNFTSSDLVGASSSTEVSAGNDFRVKPLAGLSSVASIGANYTNKWFNGSYFFNRIANSNLSSGTKETRLDTDKEQLSEWDSDFGALNFNHRFSAKITVSPASRHSLIIRPYINVEDRTDRREQKTDFRNRNGEELKFVRKRLNISDNDRGAVNAGGSVSYRYRFSNRYRSLSASLSGRYYRNYTEELTSQYTFTDEDTDFEISGARGRTAQRRERLTDQTTASASLTYTEPVSKKSRLNIEYRFNGVFSKGDNQAYKMNFNTGEYNDKPEKNQSSINKTEFITNTIGVRYNYYFKKMTVTAGLSYQNVGFTGTYTLPVDNLSDRSFHNAVYNVIANLPFNPENTLRFEARGRTINPSVNTLQTAANLSNESNIRAGNPDIVPTYIHDVKLRYIHTDKKKGMTLSVALNWLNSPNYICDSLVINNPDFIVTDGVTLGEGNQYTKPVNLGGYNKLTGKFTFGIPFKAISSNFNLNSSISVSELPGIINGDYVPVHRNWYDLGVRMDSNISENLDFSLGYTGRYTMNEFSSRFGKTENNFFSQTATGRVKYVFWKGMTVTGSVRYRQDVNTDGKYNDQFVFCDLFIGKRLFKDQLGELSIGVNDLLDEGTRHFGHTISASGTSDTINQGIGRYITVQFVYNLRVYSLRKKAG